MPKPKTRHFCLPKWRARIAKAKERGRFSPEDSNDAADWDACACKEAQQLYGIAYNGGPRDEDLYTLGCEFSRRISTYGTQFKEATVALVAIEKRLAELDRGRVHAPE